MNTFVSCWVRVQLLCTWWWDLKQWHTCYFAWRRKKTIERHEKALAAFILFLASKVIILGRMYCDHLFLEVLNVSVQWWIWLRWSQWRNGGRGWTSPSSSSSSPSSQSSSSPSSSSTSSPSPLLLSLDCAPTPSLILRPSYYHLTTITMDSYLLFLPA